MAKEMYVGLNGLRMTMTFDHGPLLVRDFTSAQEAAATVRTLDEDKLVGKKTAMLEGPDGNIVSVSLEHMVHVCTGPIFTDNLAYKNYTFVDPADVDEFRPSLGNVPGHLVDDITENVRPDQSGQEDPETLFRQGLRTYYGVDRGSGLDIIRNAADLGCQNAVLFLDSRRVGGGEYTNIGLLADEYRGYEDVEDEDHEGDPRRVLVRLSDGSSYVRDYPSRRDAILAISRLDLAGARMCGTLVIDDGRIYTEINADRVVSIDCVVPTSLAPIHDWTLLDGGE